MDKRKSIFAGGRKPRRKSQFGTLGKSSNKAGVRETFAKLQDLNMRRKRLELNEDLVRAIERIKEKTPLLKFGSKGHPKTREFWLSTDYRTLHWHSSKRSDRTQVPMDDILEVRVGQHTAKFQKAQRDDLQNVCFSIFYRASNAAADARVESLDLACRDEQELDAWVQALYALSRGDLDVDALRDQANALRAMQRERERGGGIGGTAVTLRDQTDTKGRQLTFDCYACGCNDWGQFGNGYPSASQDKPTVVQQLSASGSSHMRIGFVRDIAVGPQHLVAVVAQSGGAVKLVGAGSRVGTGLPVDSFRPRVLRPIAPALSVVRQLACGDSHTLAVTERGRVLAWGSNFMGQLGLGHTLDASQPTLVDFPGFVQSNESKEGLHIESVAAGAQHSVAVARDGRVFCWGANDCGQCGCPPSTPPVPQADSVMAVIDANGFGYTTLPELQESDDDEGVIYAVTDVPNASFGGGTLTALPALLLPRVVTQLDVVQQQSATATPTPLEDVFSSLQDESQEDRSDSPLTKAEAKKRRVRKVACGSRHTLAMSSAHVWAWGWNANGQLGVGDTNDRHAPTEVNVTKDGTVVDIDAGAVHSVAIELVKSQLQRRLGCPPSRLYVWGSNLHGQLGVEGTMRPVLRPKLVQRLAQSFAVKHVACGLRHTVIVVSDTSAGMGEIDHTNDDEQGGDDGNKTDCVVMTTGDNARGQLGADPKYVPKRSEFSPVAALAGQDVRLVAAAGHSSLFMAVHREEERTGKRFLGTPVRS
ncbi:MAG: hypothetical protein MHM6MM_001811 [Cercozoa sp. M6MM]